MKITNLIVLLTLLIPLASYDTRGAPLGTAFTYQGRLNEKDKPANGIYEVIFSLYDAESGGIRAASPITNLSLTVIEGLFTSSLDFGDGLFDGTRYWLEISLRRSGASDAFSVLAPRQSVAATPYALYAPLAGQAQSVPQGSVSTACIENAAVTSDKVAAGQVVKSVNGLHDDITISAADSSMRVTRTDNDIKLAALGSGPANGWRMDGNALTGEEFIGTLNNYPLEFRVNNQPRLSISPEGNVGVGLQPSTLRLHVLGQTRIEEASSAASLSLFAHSSVNVWGGSFFEGFRSRGTMGTPLPVQSGDWLAIFKAGAYDGDSYKGVADLVAYVGGPVSKGVVPTGWSFATSDAEGKYDVRMRIYPNGAVGIGSEYNNDRKLTVQVASGDGLMLYRPNTPRALYLLQDNGQGSWNSLTHQGDNLLTWKGSGPDNADAGGLVIAPWSAGFTGMRITHEGKVGMGTDNPQAPLHIRGNGTGIALEGTATNLTTTQSRIEFYPRGIAEGQSGWIGYSVRPDPYRPGADYVKTLRIENDDGAIELIPKSGMHVIAHSALTVLGTASAQTVTITSDREAKQDFTPVDAKKVLEKLAALPLGTWAFKNEPGTRHIGPVAQDFYASFDVGADDKHIATVDADGATMAAIQGLYQMLKEKDAEIDQLRKRLEAIEVNQERVK